MSHDNLICYVLAALGVTLSVGISMDSADLCTAQPLQYCVCLGCGLMWLGGLISLELVVHVARI